MKITKIYEYDTGGIEIGDKFYKFPVVNNNILEFFEYETFIISGIEQTNEKGNLMIKWKNGNNDNFHDISSFKLYSEGDVTETRTEDSNGNPNNVGFNFYVLDIDNRVEKEIAKRKNHIIKKTQTEIDKNIKRNIQLEELLLKLK